MRRRDLFLAPALAALPAAAQSLPDAETNRGGLSYFLLGNGLITVGVQSAPAAEAGTHAGLVVMSPDHLNRKTGSLLFHPRTGFELTRCAVWVDGKPHWPEPGRASIEWIYPDGIPTVRIRRAAAGLAVAEDLWCPADAPALICSVTIEDAPLSGVRVTATLRPNPLLFDEYEVDRARARLAAGGYHHLELFALGESRVLEREVEVTLAGTQTAHFVLTLDAPGMMPDLAALRLKTADAWNKPSAIRTGDRGFDAMLRAATHGIRAAVARSGKMDGGIWQYNLEWVRDASMVAEGAVFSGQPDIAGAILRRILTRMVRDDGAALDSSFHRPPETIELDQNGQLLHALWTHWAWTGDFTLIREFWPRIRALADYPLRPEFRGAAPGLVKNSREFWERGPSYGVRDGYELAYQAWNIAAWPLAAEMAEKMDDGQSAGRWRDAAARMKRTFLSDPRYSFIENGRFIKRRLADGRHHATMEPPNREALPPGMPLRVDPVNYCDPDAASVFPMLLGIADPRGAVARATLESVETLWNQRWTTGGYGRYHVSGEPDSPGPWPFASLFIARAWLEAGDSAKVWRVLRWLEGVPGGRSGAWFEFYGERPSPPLPQVAIIPWIWAELLALGVNGVAGVRPTPTELVIRPRLLDGLDGAGATLPFNGGVLELRIRRSAGPPSATVNGRPVPFAEGALRIPRPEAGAAIEIRL